MASIRLIILILLTPPLLSCGPSEPHEALALSSALGEGEDAGYARATAPRLFRFPQDHGAHPDFRNEWWYFTGNLATAEGRRFGYQLTLFRIALSAEKIDSTSAWRSRQLFMGHFAVSDLDRARFFNFERFARAAAGVAGAENPPLRLWLDHWQIEALEPSGFPMRLRASEEGIAIDLTLTPSKPIVLNGEQGLSQKSAAAGNASYYYSVTRLASHGSVTLESLNFAVTGSSWLDREWSTSALADNQAGWDWFALQLEDGRDLMIYQLRRKDGSSDPASAGTLVMADGSTRSIKRDEMRLTVLAHWRSPTSGVRYPSRWQIQLFDQLDLTVEPVIPNQEMNTLVRYWEGAVSVQGVDGESAIKGVGYMELSGYGE